jgi:hypothetical protein
LLAIKTTLVPDAQCYLLGARSFALSTFESAYFSMFCFYFELQTFHFTGYWAILSNSSLFGWLSIIFALYFTLLAVLLLKFSLETWACSARSQWSVLEWTFGMDID